MFVPYDLYVAVSELQLQDGRDAVHVRRLLANPEYVTQGGLNWLAALVAREGAKFDRHNAEHCVPHVWPLQVKGGAA